MLNSAKIYYYLAVIAVCLWPFTASAQDLAASAAAANPEPMTVSDVVIDKTDTNAVTARDKAIIEAQRAAFSKLAQKYLSPKAFMEYKLPTDDIIASVVKDFEIKNEQLSSNRYVANFTVRFTDQAANFFTAGAGAINNPAASGSENSAAAPAAVPAENTAAAAGEVADNKNGTTVLVLPYYKNSAGQEVLWEDPNPWREAWQSFGKMKTAAGAAVIVPLGDLDDIAQGSADAVWKGDYSPMEKLKEKYKGSELLLAVADVKDNMINVAIYTYTSGSLKYKKSLVPVVPSADIKTDFWHSISQMLGDTELLAAAADTTAEPALPSSDNKPLRLDIIMAFGSFKDWITAQKLMAATAEPPEVKIVSLNNGEVNFTIDLPSADALERLRKNFLDKGLILLSPDASANGSASGNILLRRYFLKLEERHDGSTAAPL